MQTVADVERTSTRAPLGERGELRLPLVHPLRRSWARAEQLPMRICVSAGRRRKPLARPTVAGCGGWPIAPARAGLAAGEWEIAFGSCLGA